MAGLWKVRADGEAVTTLTIVLPWPTTRLWPNHQPRSPQALHKLRKQAGGDARLLINNALQHSAYRAPADGPIAVSLTFCPSIRTSRFDEDGAQGAMKAQLDQLAAALGVDDSRFAISPAKGMKGGDGCVIVRLGGGEAK